MYMYCSHCACTVVHVHCVLCVLVHVSVYSTSSSVVLLLVKMC